MIKNWFAKMVERPTVPSRIAVQGAPSSCSRRISLRATTESVRRLMPLKTVAYVPYNRTEVIGHLESTFLGS